MSEPGGHFLVTGAAAGIGAACARLLARRGADRLLLIDRDAASLDALHLPCPVARHTGDIADPGLWERIEAEAEPGALDGAILNAGVTGSGAIAESSLADWRAVLGPNLDGAFLSLRSALRLIRDGGAIVLTASASGLKAEAGTAAYAASKAGVLQLAKVAAKEAAPRGVRVNAIAPGGVATGMWDDIPFFADLLAAQDGDREAAFGELARAATPLGRFASAEQIAAQIAFLLSADAASITGTVLVSDGGYTL